MKQDISSLMDGELFEDEAGGTLDKIKRDSARREDWEMYHLIGDVLRQPECIPCANIRSDLSSRVRKCMEDEPIILAPREPAVKQKVRAFVVSAAASLLAVGVVVWMSLQISPEVTPQVAMQQTAIRPANLQTRSNPNDYLMAHQEFSPSTEMKGGASYIHTVSYGTGEK